MLSIGIALNATGESSGGILWPVPPRSHKLFLCSNIDLTDHFAHDRSHRPGGSTRFSYGAVEVLHEEISFNLTRAKSWGCSVQTGRGRASRPAAK
jgi:hypothetical protein